MSAPNDYLGAKLIIIATRNTNRDWKTGVVRGWDNGRKTANVKIGKKIWMFYTEMYIEVGIPISSARVRILLSQLKVNSYIPSNDDW